RRLRTALLVPQIPGIGNLSAAGGVKGRLVELDLERAVAAVVKRGDRRQDVGLLVADEVRLRPLDLELDGDGGARARALLLHQPRELLVVDPEATLAAELLRQLEREAVGVVEPERVLPGDVAAFFGHLLEQPHAAREGLAEAFLLGGED